MTVDPVDAPAPDLALLEEAIHLEEIEKEIAEGVAAVALTKTMQLNRSTKSLSFLAQKSWVQVQMCQAHRSALSSLQTWPCNKT